MKEIKHETKHCLNCTSIIKNNFCSVCGQRTELKRISGKEVVEEITHFFTHIEKNFLRTSAEMLIRPGTVLHNYLNGQRKKYQTPLSYLIIWVAFAWLVKSWVIWRFDYKVTLDPSTPPSYGAATIYFRNHTYLLILIIVPVVALIAYVFMSRPRYNYFEILIICFFGYGTYHIVELLFSTLLLGVIFHGNIISWQVANMNLLIGGFWCTWILYHFYKIDKVKYFWLRLIVCALVIDYIVFYIIVYTPVIWTYLVK